MYEDGSYGKQVDAKTIRVLSKGSGTSGSPVSTAASAEAPAPTRSFGPPQKVFPVPLMHGDRSIIRQNALTNAREAVAHLSFTTMPTDAEYASRIIAMARMFEEYSAGDIERRAAEGSE